MTALLNKGWIRTYPALEVQFQSGSAYWSTVPLTLNDIDYADRLKKVSSLKATSDRAVDRGEITLDNIDLAIGDMFDDADDTLLENVPAILYTIYENIRDASERYLVEKMAGMLYSYTEEGEGDLVWTLISDAYAGGGVAPFEVKPSCVFQYKDGINCTYAGTIPTCDLSFNGRNGCITHFGLDMARARYGGGGTDLDEAAKRNFTPYEGGGSSNIGGCFFGSTPISTNDKYEDKPIRLFRKGDEILSFDKGTFQPESDKAEKDVLRHKFRNWYYLVFSDGSFLNVTRDHPFFPQPGLRITTENLELGMRFRRNVGGIWRTVSLISKSPRTSLVPIDFYNVPVSKNHDYFANGFPVSNVKQYNPNNIP